MLVRGVCEKETSRSYRVPGGAIRRFLTLPLVCARRLRSSNGLVRFVALQDIMRRGARKWTGEHTPLSQVVSSVVQAGQWSVVHTSAVHQQCLEHVSGGEEVYGNSRQGVPGK